jgi:FlaA1/EpsC-like NDP-sugar epimerase
MSAGEANVAETGWFRAPSKYFGRFLFDLGAWAFGLWAASLLRYDLDASRIDYRGLFVLLPIAAIVQYGLGCWSGIYRGGYLYGAFEEVAALVRTTSITGVAVITTDLAIGEIGSLDRPVPKSAALGGAIFAMGMQGAVRYVWRMIHDARRRPNGEDVARVLVFGAGDGGQQVIRAMLRNPASPYLPVGVIDDHPERRNLSIMGVRVLGPRHELAAAASRCAADVLLIAVPSADGTLVRELADEADAIGLKLRVLPSVVELLDGEVDLGDIREPTEADLLGRHQVETDLQEISEYLTGRVVAVTGAGGSIGSELCRQIARFEPAQLIMIDRDESALHAVQLSLEGRALLDTPNLVLLDIRDRVRVRRLFQDRRPDVVFHAAALKHLPLLESHPIEALKTNVWGTLSVLDAALAAGVPTFVNISTDKAANPVSILGYSKRVAEGLTADAARRGDGRYLSVRFGNVLGSRGSVLTAFRSQIDNGGPLTVTHPEVTRFFMTVEEAVQLVVQAGAVGEPGEVLVLDMGEPVRIAEVAERLASRASQPIDIVYTGLRPGEKMHEELFGDFEAERCVRHPMIDAVSVPALDPELVRHVDTDVPCEYVRSLLRDLVELMNIDSIEEDPGAYSVPA